MAAIAVLGKPVAGQSYTYTTVDSGDWASVPVDTYFLNLDVSDYGLKYKNPEGLILVGFSKAGNGNGAFGIADSDGVYTFYATITLAMAAAVSGDVIDQFADIVETGIVSVIWKNGVTGRANGHTYTYTNPEGVCFTDNNVAVEATIDFNVIRTSATILNSSQYAWHWDSNNSKINRAGGTTKMTITTGSFTAIRCDAKLFEGENAFAYGNGVALDCWNAAGEMNNCYGETTIGARAVLMYSAKSSNVTGICTGAGTHGILAGQGVYKYCQGITAGTGNGIQFQANATAIWCYAKSVSGHAMSIFNEAIFCDAESSSGAAFSSCKFVKNCTGKSATNSAIRSAVVNAEITGCDLTSAGDRVVQPTNAIKILNNTLRSTYNNANGDGIYFSTAVVGAVISNNVIITTHASANAVFANTPATTIDYSANEFDCPVGATFASVNIVQGLATSPDSQGNLTMR